MFGYITPVQGELKVNDFNTFKKYYCGLCLCLKDKYGNIPRIFLNYDTTFFAIFLDALRDDELCIKCTNCIRHPFSKREYTVNNDVLNYAADLNVALVYYKLLDNVIDDNDLKSISSSKIFKHYYTKIDNLVLKKIIHTSLTSLHELEKSNINYSLDTISHPFSHIIGTIFKYYPGKLKDDSEKLRDYLYNFGYSFGKWIYLIDALDDLKEDITLNSFNPLEKAFNKNFTYNELVNYIKDDLDFIILNLINNCSNIIKKINFYKNKNIIENTINLGLINTYTNILYKI